MSTSRFLVAGLLAAASLTISGCGGRDLNYKQVEIDELKDQVRDLEDQLDACEKRKAAVDFGNMPKSAPTSDYGRIIGGNATVGERAVETYISIPGSVLFTPGSAKLTSEAKATLSRAIEFITEKYPHHHVRIDGFTDNEPVVRSKDKWDDNFDLSGGRALSVLHYLEAHGIPQKDLGFSGFGQERPKAANSTEANRAKNRRVEIVIGDEDTAADEAIPDDTSSEPTPVHHKAVKKKKKVVKPAASTEGTGSSTPTTLEPGPSSSGFSSSGTTSGFSSTGGTTSGFSSTGGTTSGFSSTGGTTSGFSSTGGTTAGFSSTGGTTAGTAAAGTAPAATVTPVAPPAHTTP